MSIKHQGQSKAFTFCTKAFFIFSLFHYFFILSFGKLSRWSTVNEHLKFIKIIKEVQTIFINEQIC